MKNIGTVLKKFPDKRDTVCVNRCFKRREL